MKLNVTVDCLEMARYKLHSVLTLDSDPRIVSEMNVPFLFGKSAISAWIPFTTFLKQISTTLKWLIYQ